MLNSHLVLSMLYWVCFISANGSKEITTFDTANSKLPKRPTEQSVEDIQVVEFVKEKEKSQTKSLFLMSGVTAFTEMHSDISNGKDNGARSEAEESTNTPTTETTNVESAFPQSVTKENDMNSVGISLKNRTINSDKEKNEFVKTEAKFTDFKFKADAVRDQLLTSKIPDSSNKDTTLASKLVSSHHVATPASLLPTIKDVTISNTNEKEDIEKGKTVSMQKTVSREPIVDATMRATIKGFSRQMLEHFSMDQREITLPSASSNLEML